VQKKLFKILRSCSEELCPFQPFNMQFVSNVVETTSFNLPINIL